MTIEQKNTPISEQQLILYYYDDGLTPQEKQAISRALQTDAMLAARYRDLFNSLNELQVETHEATPTHIKPQWHELIGREAQLERQSLQKLERPQHWLGWAASLATMLVLGIAVGIWLQPATTSLQVPERGLVELSPKGQTPKLQPAEIGSTAFTRAVQFYLDGQQTELAGMGDKGAEANQLILLQIIAQNRLIERAAVANNAPELARLMRAFEPVLFKLADKSTSPDESAALQRQLAFELQAVLTKLQQAPSKSATVI